jgi:hypothetical protein
VWTQLAIMAIAGRHLNPDAFVRQAIGTRRVTSEAKTALLTVYRLTDSLTADYYTDIH